MSTFLIQFIDANQTQNCNLIFPTKTNFSLCRLWNKFTNRKQQPLFSFNIYMEEKVAKKYYFLATGKNLEYSIEHVFFEKSVYIYVRAKNSNSQNNMCLKI